MITPLTTDQTYSSNSLSASNSMSPSTSSGFDLSQFEAELAQLVNQCLQNAGVSPSQATFSFTPANTSSPAATASGASSPVQSAPTSGISTPAAPLANAAANATPAAVASQNSAAASDGQYLDAVGRQPGIDTHGPDAPCIYDIHNDRFWNAGNTSGDRFMIDPLQGKPVDYDAIVRGLEQVYGADNHAQVGHAMTMRFGDSFLQQYELDHPGQYNAIMDTKPLTNFELYGAYGSFTDTDGLSHYYDEKGVEHLSHSAKNDAYLAKQAAAAAQNSAQNTANV
jgi:hypothetical protein